MKRPSFQFYPGDWLNDAALRMVSVGARGLWMDMLCLMHQGSDYGFLKVNHTPILPANLARMTGATLVEAEGWLAELESAGVFSRDDSGCVFSRRMIRDEQIREARAAGGSKGGNPALMAKKKASEKDNLRPNLAPTPSSSSSSSKDKNPPYPPEGGDPIVFKKREGKPTIEFKTFMANCKANGESAVPDGDPIFDYADEAGISHEWLALQWHEFKARYSAGSKRYSDWRKVYRNSVRGNWFKLWFIREDSTCGLTTQGMQAKAAFDSKAARS